MNEIWPELIQRTIEPPRTITETVDRLINVLEEEHKLVIAVMQEKELINLHFGLGMAIRNAFGFWDPNSPLIKACTAISPDDISDRVIHELWQRLKQKYGSRSLYNTFSH